jgi:hypothetical protein
LQSIEVVYSEKIVAAFLQEQAGSQAYVVVPFIARGAGELDKNPGVHRGCAGKKKS